VTAALLAALAITGAGLLVYALAPRWQPPKPPRRPMALQLRDLGRNATGEQIRYIVLKWGSRGRWTP